MLNNFRLIIFSKWFQDSISQWRSWFRSNKSNCWDFFFPLSDSRSNSYLGVGLLGGFIKPFCHFQGLLGCCFSQLPWDCCCSRLTQIWREWGTTEANSSDTKFSVLPRSQTHFSKKHSSDCLKTLINLHSSENVDFDSFHFFFPVFSLLSWKSGFTESLTLSLQKCLCTPQVLNMVIKIIHSIKHYIMYSITKNWIYFHSFKNVFFSFSDGKKCFLLYNLCQEEKQIQYVYHVYLLY